MLAVKEVKGTIENPDIEQEINDCLDKLSQIDGDVQIYDVKYSVSQDIETGVFVSSAIIIFFIE